MKICLFQMLDRGSVEENVRRACEVIENTKADFICLPEFFAIPGEFFRRYSAFELYRISSHVLDELIEASRNFDGYVVAGTVVEKGYYNTCYVLKCGEMVAKYRKINPTKDEIRMGIKPGRSVTVIETKFGRIGLLICADCLNWDTVKEVASVSDVIFLPISLSDPNHPPVEGHPISKKIADTFDIVVAKVSRIGVWRGKKFGTKSVVLSKEGIIAEAEKIDEELIFADF